MNKLYYFLFIFLPISINAQEYILQDSLKITDVKQLTYDLEGNLYILSSNSFYKYISESAEITQYTSSAAIQNFSVPSKWKIYLFSDQSVQILNQQLAPLGEAITTSGKPLIADLDNSIWQINYNSRKLVKTDLTTNQDIISYRISDDPLQVIIANNNIYIKTTDNEVLVYNTTGRLLEKLSDIKYPLIKAIDQVFLLKNKKLINLQSDKALILPMPAIQAAVAKTYLALANEDTVFIYRTKK